MTVPALVLASASAARAAMLERAGVPCACDPAGVDEDEVKHAMRAAGRAIAEIADALAELKAAAVSRRHPRALVIGADQMLACNDALFDKPADRAAARAHLEALSGRTHELVTAAVVVRDGVRIWHAVDRAQLTMRRFGAGFIEAYLDAIGDEACRSVGAYQLEGRGAQLFTRVSGDFFTILGLPLLPLLEFLRSQGVLPR